MKCAWRTVENVLGCDRMALADTAGSIIRPRTTLSASHNVAVGARRPTQLINSSRNVGTRPSTHGPELLGSKPRALSPSGIASAPSVHTSMISLSVGEVVRADNGSPSV
jgi:hypothetical protein